MLSACNEAKNKSCYGTIYALNRKIC